jgi:hypothetical protein
VCRLELALNEETGKLDVAPLPTIDQRRRATDEHNS